MHAALATGCDALHPGYGFLSENPRLAALCTDVVFVGPPAGVIELAGDKLRARDGRRRGRACRSSPAARSRAPPRRASRIGFPLLLKAAGGGGGRGIRLAHDEAELRAQFGRGGRRGRRGVRRPARIRRALRRGRAARRGPDRRRRPTATSSTSASATARSSAATRRSSRRRPRPRSRPVARGADAAAVAFARAIGYVNLGTVEFMVDGDAFYFLEMNCRIQVEHPVTEAVTGLDLVAEQLRIAAGEPLSFAQDEVALRRSRDRGAADRRGAPGSADPALRGARTAACASTPTAPPAR